MEEVDKCFFSMGVNLSDDELLRIAERFDADKSGEMDSGEFCDMVVTLMNDDGGWTSGPGGSLESGAIRSAFKNP